LPIQNPVSSFLYLFLISSVRDLTRKPEQAKKNCFSAAYGGPYPPFAPLTAPRRSARPKKEFAPLTTFVLGLRPKP